MGKPSGGTRFTINGTRGDDILSGAGNSHESGGLIISGNAGNDTIAGGFGPDILNGGDGNDRVYGDLADLSGAGGNGKIVWDGGKGTDTLDLSGISSAEGRGIYLSFDYRPTGSARVMTNIDKDDASVWGPTSSDATYLGNFQGFENFTMGAGNDWVFLSTYPTNNVLHGGAGNDYLSPGAGSDTVYGDDGDDVIDGGWGSDIEYGGAGRDFFVWQGRLAGEYTYDTIKDFDAKSAPDDTQFDVFVLSGSWTVQWDANSPGVLHGYLMDGSTIFGEVTLEGLTYADASSVVIGHTDANTGAIIY